MQSATGEGGISLLSIANVLLRRMRFIIFFTLVLATIAVLMTLFSSVTFVATSRFTPETAQVGISRLSSLASQFGIDAGASGGGESLQFYAELLNSPELLRDVVVTEYVVDDGERGRRGGTLIELLEIEGETPSVRLRRAVDDLRERTSVGSNYQANLISVEIRAPWPELAVAVNRRMLQLVNRFNLERRQSRAGAEREFVEGRLEQAQQELRAAEERYINFVQANRRYDASPELTFEANRLQQEVSAQEEVILSLQQAFEKAKIEEVRNTPVVTVVDDPQASVRPDGTNLILNVLVALVFGLMVGSAMALILEYLERERREEPEEYAEFRRLRKRVVASMLPRRLADRITRRPRGSGTD